MSDSVWPQRRLPTRLPHPWDSPDKNTGVGCHFHLQCMKVKSESEVAQSCPTPSDPMDYSLPGPSIHRIFQAGVLEWVAIAFSEYLLYIYTISYYMFLLYITFQMNSLNPSIILITKGRLLGRGGVKSIFQVKLQKTKALTWIKLKFYHIRRPINLKVFQSLYRGWWKRPIVNQFYYLRW